MKLFSLFVFAALLLFVGVACNRHPASETIPGYNRHQRVDLKEALVPSAHPVKLFSEKNTTSVN